MEDMLLNGFMRMAVDNGALSGNFDRNWWNKLVPGQDLSDIPAKSYTPSRAPDKRYSVHHFQMFPANYWTFDKARQASRRKHREVMPGIGGVKGVGRTASGMCFAVQLSEY